MSPVESFDYSSVQSRPKRKLDDYAPNLDADDDDAEISDLVSVRMRRDEANAVHQLLDLNGTVSEVIASEVVSRISRRGLQFFIRMMPEGNTMVIQANSSDTVKSIHERIQAMTGIPLIEQRLIYRGKQLQWEQSLGECSIQNDAGLQLVGRMRSTGHPQAWQVIDDMVSVIFRLCRGETIHHALKHLKSRMSEFFSMTPKVENESSIGHIQIFMSSSAPAALVMLYISPLNGNKDVADNAIRHFLNSSKISLPKNLHSQCAPIVLEFCKLLGKFTPDDTLYLACRSTLGSLLENFGGPLLEKIGIARGLKYGDEVKGLNVIRDIFPFVRELFNRITRDLVSSMEMVLSVGPLVSDVRDFTAFLHPLRKAILGLVGSTIPISMPLPKRAFSDSPHGDEMECLHDIFEDLLMKMNKCLGRVEERLIAKANGEGEINYSGWSQYLTILRELYATSKLFQGAEEQFWKVVRCRKSPLCALILRYARRSDDNRWLLEHKDVTNFEARRYLAMMMFPDVKEDYEDLHEMLIDRSHLLSESFEYIASADPEALSGGLFMEFKNEEANGPGVLREWFFLVCQDLFNPQNALFVACPNDRRRFYPNPASKVDPLHLRYFSFSGRVIALALMHRVQVGVVFDRVFYLQLADKNISLEDIRDADPSLYSSYKLILEMDAEFIDSDGLALTFVREVEELGSRKIVELCPGGKSMVVNSKNREKYVDLLIQHQFVTSISEQTSYFVKGFSDILSNASHHKLFFQSLELEDLDRMLFGSERAICTEDWKAHTEYNGYKENDPQILWFWKIVGEMSPEQRKILLFFWTSVKHLPVEGFGGLASLLHINKSAEPDDRLPTSHTCFYQLCFPPYPSMVVMQDKLHIITQEHVGCSFGAL